jgi:dephospho-CoA kinase
MIAAQMPIEEKRKLAHRVIDNSGTREETRRQVEKLWTEISR